MVQDALWLRRREQFGEEWVLLFWDTLISSRLGSSVNFEAMLNLLGDEELRFVTTPEQVSMFLAAMTSLDHITCDEARRELALLMQYVRMVEAPRGMSTVVLQLHEELGPIGRESMELATLGVASLAGIKRIYTFRPHLFPRNTNKVGVQILVPPGGTPVPPPSDESH